VNLGVNQFTHRSPHVLSASFQRWLIDFPAKNVTVEFYKALLRWRLPLRSSPAPRAPTTHEGPHIKRLQRAQDRAEGFQALGRSARSTLRRKELSSIQEQVRAEPTYPCL